MKFLLFILLLTVPLVSIATPVLHSHDGRVHNHALPLIGIAHQHGRGSVGILSSSTSLTTGNKSPVINQPNTVIFNSFPNNNLGGSQAKERVNTLPNKGKNKNMVEYLDGIEAKLHSCIQRSKQVICKFTIKNTAEKDISKTLDANSFLIDSKGDKYSVSQLKFGNIVSRGFPRKLLIKNIPVSAELIFNKVESFGSTIPLLKGVLSGRPYIEFRNVPLLH